MARKTRVLLILLLLATAACGSSGDRSEGAKTPAPSDTTSAASAVSTTSAAAKGPAAPDASPYVEGIGDLSRASLPPGNPGEVTIIASTATIDRSGSVLMVVRNNTSKDIGAIDVSGTARDDAGKLVDSGSSQGFQPKLVAPGEIAFGYVYFDIELAGQTLKYTFTVDARPAETYFASVKITELNVTGGKIVGAVKNDSNREVTGPISANVICFGSDGALSADASDFVEPGSLPVGGSGSFAIDISRDPCPIGLVAASGYSR